MLPSGPQRPSSTDTFGDVLRQQQDFLKSVGRPAAAPPIDADSVAEPQILGEIHENTQTTTREPPTHEVEVPTRKKSIFAKRAEAEKAKALPESNVENFQSFQATDADMIMAGMSAGELLQYQANIRKQILQMKDGEKLLSFLKGRHRTSAEDSHEAEKQTTSIELAPTASLLSNGIRDETVVSDHQSISQTEDMPATESLRNDDDVDELVSGLIEGSNDYKWLHMNVVEPKKLAWIKETDTSVDARFSQTGEISKDNSAHTIEELFEKSRSSMMQQVVYSLKSLGNILRKAKQGEYCRYFSRPLTSHLIENGIVFIIRFCLDSEAPAVQLAALQCMERLLDTGLNDSSFMDPASLYIPVARDDISFEGQAFHEKKDAELLKLDVVMTLIQRMNLTHRLKYIIMKVAKDRRLCSESDELICCSALECLSSIALHSRLAAELVMNSVSKYLVPDFVADCKLPRRVEQRVFKLLAILGSSAKCFQKVLFSPWSEYMKTFDLNANDEWKTLGWILRLFSYVQVVPTFIVHRVPASLSSVVFGLPKVENLDMSWFWCQLWLLRTYIASLGNLATLYETRLEIWRCASIPFNAEEAACINLVQDSYRNQFQRLIPAHASTVGFLPTTAVTIFSVQRQWREIPAVLPMVVCPGDKYLQSQEYARNCDANDVFKWAWVGHDYPRRFALVSEYRNMARSLVVFTSKALNLMQDEPTANMCKSHSMRSAFLLLSLLPDYDSLREQLFHCILQLANLSATDVDFLNRVFPPFGERTSDFRMSFSRSFWETTAQVTPLEDTAASLMILELQSRTFCDKALPMNKKMVYDQLAAVYLKDGDIFLDSGIQEIASSLLELLWGQGFPENEVAEDTYGGLQRYKELLENYTAQSYSDTVFALLLVIPCMAKQNSAYREALWDSDALPLIKLGINQHKALDLFQHTQYEDSGTTAIKRYADAILNDQVVVGSALYYVAVHHLNRWFFHQIGSNDERKVLFYKLLNERNLKVCTELLQYVAIRKCPAGDKVDFYEELPEIRATFLTQLLHRF